MYRVYIKHIVSKNYEKKNIKMQKKTDRIYYANIDKINLCKQCITLFFDKNGVQ